MSDVMDNSPESLQSLTLLQNFGLAAFLVIAGVLSTWVYLKRAGGEELLSAPELELLAINTVETIQAATPIELDEVQTWIQFGEEAYEAGRIVSPVADNALYYFKKALARSPKDRDVLTGIDRVFQHLLSASESAIFQGDWTRARQYSEQLDEMRPNDQRALELLNRINRLEQLENLITRGDRQIAASRLTEPPGDNALQTYRRILEIDPGNTTASDSIASIVQRLLGVAQSAALAGEQEKAQRFVAKVRAIEPTASGLAEAEQLVAQWAEMAKDRHLREQLEAASAALEAGQLAEPDQPNALFLFDKALELDPGSEAARQGKSLVIKALAERAWVEIRGSRFGDAARSVELARSAGAESYTLVELEDELLYQEALAKARRGEFDRLYLVSELETRRRATPDYPKGASEDGWVEMRFTVSEEGKVLDAEVYASSNEMFNDAATRAINRWTFKPPMFKGRPIAVRSGVRFAFKG